MKRCDVCNQRGAVAIAGILVCPKHGARLRAKGAGWIAWAEQEWRWCCGHGAPP